MKVGDHILLSEKRRTWLGQITTINEITGTIKYIAITEGYDQDVGEFYTAPPEWVIDSAPNLSQIYPELFI